MRAIYDWILRLAGKDPSKFDRVGPTLNQPPEGWEAFVAVAAVFLFVWWLYRGDGRRFVRAPFRFLLGVLRVALLFVLLLLLTEPVLTAVRTETKRSTVAVLVDDSYSMDLKFPHVEKKLSARVLRALGKQYSLSYTDADGKKVVVPPGKVTAAELRYVSRLDVVKAALRRKGAAAKDFLAALAERHEVRFLPFSLLIEDKTPAAAAGKTGKEKTAGERSKKQPESGERSLKPEDLRPRGKETRLGDCLRRALRELRGRPLAGVVLLSDGRQNAGEDAVAVAKRLKTRRVPIFTVGVGDPGEPKDFALTVEGPETVLPDDPFDLVVTVTRSGYKDLTALHVEVKDGERLVASRELKFAPERNRASVAVPLRSTETGKYTYTVSVPVKEGELRADNNTATHVFSVVDKKLKILFVEGLDRPRWEYRYLKNALRRDHTAEADVLLVVGEGDAFLWDGTDGKEPLDGFPTRKKDLFAYDTVILGDVSPEVFTKEQMKLLREFIREGGGLILIAGERNMPAAYVKSPLSELLPVDVAGGFTEEESAELEPFSLELTKEGAAAAWTRLDNNEAVNREIWAELPKLWWYYPVKRKKKMAVAVAVHPYHKDADGKKMPLVVLMPYGSGQVLYIGVDDLWRWRRGVGERYHYRFYNQAIRRLSLAKRLGADKRFSLGVEKSVYAVGDRVLVDAEVKDENMKPLRDTEITAHGIIPGGEEFTVRLKALPGRPGAYEGEFYPLLKGGYTLWLLDPRRPTVHQAEIDFKVALPQLEYENPRMDEKLLKNIAAAAGGKYFDIDRLDKIPPLISPRKETVQHPETVRLWDNWFPFILFVLLLTAEWLLRKRARLV